MLGASLALTACQSSPGRQRPAGSRPPHGSNDAASPTTATWGYHDAPRTLLSGRVGDDTWEVITYQSEFGECLEVNFLQSEDARICDSKLLSTPNSFRLFETQYGDCDGVFLFGLVPFDIHKLVVTTSKETSSEMLLPGGASLNVNRAVAYEASPPSISVTAYDRAGAQRGLHRIAEICPKANP